MQDASTDGNNVKFRLYNAGSMTNAISVIFRKNRSTALALMITIDNISFSTDKNKYTTGVFVDLKKKLLIRCNILF